MTPVKFSRVLALLVACFTIVAHAQLIVTPSSSSIVIGQTVQLSSTAGSGVKWTTSQPNIASVNSVGLVTGLAPGMATITARKGNQSGSAVITVTLPSGGGEGDIHAASCSQADVQAAIDRSVDGDVVTVPAGICAWTSPVTVGKSITLQGAGSGSTVISDDGVTAFNLLTWTTKDSGGLPAGFARLTGFTFDTGTTGVTTPNAYLVIMKGNSANVRVDHDHFVTARSRGLLTSGYVRGVIDHNTFDDNVFGMYSLVTRQETWGNADESYCAGMSISAGCGDASWAAPVIPGSLDAIYVENNIFNNGSGGVNWSHDGDFGGRGVFRFNTWNNAIWAAHGTERDGRPRGYRWAEHYRETINISSPVYAAFPSVIGMPSGSGMVFDNVVNHTNNASTNVVFDMVNIRNEDPSFRGWSTWGRCGIRPVTLTRNGITATGSTNWSGVHVTGSWVQIVGSIAPFNGTYFATAPAGNSTEFTFTVPDSGAVSSAGSVQAPWDGNTDAQGYRCLDSPGAGSGDRIFGFIFDVSTLPVNQALEPIYIWNNLSDRDYGSGTNYQLTAGFMSFGSAVVLENREYYNQDIAFTGSTGLGRGLLSARPATCTTGVGYWATDEGEWDSTNGSTPDGRLYFCSSTNIWALYYTPSIYPHQLVK